MTLDEILAEMARKPDAQMLIEWIDDHLNDRALYESGAIRHVIDVYFDALEG